MNRLIIELPDEQMLLLEQAARTRGESIQRVLTELVATLDVDASLDPPYDVTTDPIYRIRAHDSAAPSDLAQNVDRYLYNAEDE